MYIWHSIGVLFCLCVPSLALCEHRSSFKLIVDLEPKNTAAKPAPRVVQQCTEVLKGRPPAEPPVMRKALWSRGCAYLRMGEPGRAHDDFAALCKLRPQDPVFRALRALALADLGRMEDAEAEALEALGMDPEIAAHHVVLGSICVAQGKWGPASLSAESALAIDKEFPSALYLRGWAACGQGDYKLSIASFDRLFGNHSSTWMREPEFPHLIRGLAYLGLGRHREALGSLSTARKLNPMSADVAERISSTYFEMGKWHMAAKAAVDAATLAADDPRLHLACGVLQARIGQRREAEDSLRKAKELLRTAEKDASTRQYVNSYAGMIYFQLGEYQKASDLIDAAADAGGLYDQGLWAKCMILASCPDAKYRDGRGALGIATAILNDAKQMKQNQFHVHVLLADAHAECGDFPSAVASVRKALETAGDRDVKQLRERLELFENNKPYRHVPATK
jgi:tetratricopeptide (TPR) repeat protein